jgi:hypothetical protein
MTALNVAAPAWSMAWKLELNSADKNHISSIVPIARNITKLLRTHAIWTRYGWNIFHDRYSGINYIELPIKTMPQNKRLRK